MSSHATCQQLKTPLKTRYYIKFLLKTYRVVTMRTRCFVGWECIRCPLTVSLIIYFPVLNHCILLALVLVVFSTTLDRTVRFFMQGFMDDSPKSANFCSYLSDGACGACHSLLRSRFFPVVLDLLLSEHFTNDVQQYITPLLGRVVYFLFANSFASPFAQILIFLEFVSGFEIRRLETSGVFFPCSALP